MLAISTGRKIQAGNSITSCRMETLAYGYPTHRWCLQGILRASFWVSVLICLTFQGITHFLQDPLKGNSWKASSQCGWLYFILSTNTEHLLGANRTTGDKTDKHPCPPELTFCGRKSRETNEVSRWSCMSEVRVAVEKNKATKRRKNFSFYFTAKSRDWAA